MRWQHAVQSSLQTGDQFARACCGGDFGAGGREIPFHVTANDQDQHVEVVSSGSGKFALTIQVKDNFGFVYNSKLPALGNRSEGLRVLSQTWNASRDTLTLEVAGKPGRSYELDLVNSMPNASANRASVASVEGGDHFIEGGQDTIEITFPSDTSEQYAHRKVVLRFLVFPDVKGKRVKAGK